MENEIKLNCVVSTIKRLEEMAEENEKHSADWYKANVNDLGNYYEGKAKAFRFAVELLKGAINE